jgi:hypothetical protein
MFWTQVYFLSALISTSSAGQIDIGPSGSVYGHNYSAWGSPLTFNNEDIYAISNATIGMGDYGYHITMATGTSQINPGYVIYKVVAPSGKTIRKIQLTIKAYQESASNITGLKICYTTTGFSGTPNFSTWNDLNFPWAQYWSQNTMTIYPNSSVVYIAYAGWNTGSVSWACQIGIDKLEVNQNDLASQVDLGSDGGTYGHNYNGYSWPRTFNSGDLYCSSNVEMNSGDYGNQIVFSNATTASNPGYVIYKFTVPAGKVITEIRISLETYLENPSSTNDIDVYCTGTEFYGAPNFANWSNGLYTWGQYWSERLVTFYPNNQVVYVAYVGWNNGGASWTCQIGTDKVQVSTDILKKDLTPGHTILLNKGLQIEALIFPQLEDNGQVVGFSLTRFSESKFTMANLVSNYWSTGCLGTAPGIPWGRWSGGAYDLQTSELTYLPNMVSFQWGDENNITDPVLVQILKNWFALNRSRYPDVISHENQSPDANFSYDQLKAFVVEAKPDMLMFDSYPFSGILVGGSPTMLYRDFQLYRNVALAGLDGYGAKPIPCGVYAQAFRDATHTHTPSESELRLNQFAAWTFGMKYTSLYVYMDPRADNVLDAVLFNGIGDSSPTGKFTEVATVNDMSRKLGSALVRLISTDVRMKLGRHWTGRTEWWQTGPWDEANAQPSGVALWSSTGDPYMTAISASNPGPYNTYRREDAFDYWYVELPGDVVIGYFKPLHESFDGPSYTNQKYFMITNGLTDKVGNAYGCRQTITVDFNFGSSGITGLQRKRRSDGVVENIVSGGSYSGLTFTSLGGSSYRLVLTLEGGTGDLFKYNTGAPFVGSDL